MAGWGAVLVLIWGVSGCVGGELYLKGQGPWPEQRLDRLVRIHEDRFGGMYHRFALTSLDPDEPVDPDGWLAAIYPREQEVLRYPEVVFMAGAPEVRPFRFDATVSAAIEQGENLRIAGDCPQATRHYQQALSLQANAYPAKLGLGLCLLTQGKVKEALDMFDQARLDNALDRRIHLARAVALVVLEKTAAARRALAAALALSPRNTEILGLAKAYAKPLGLSVHTRLFRPLARIRKVDGGLVVETTEGPGARAWRRWAMCKALWLGSPEYRQRRLGRHFLEPGLEEETECLAVLVHTVENDEDMPADLEYLVRIYRAGKLHDLAVYELLSRIDPQMTLMLAAEQRDALAEFIETFVLGAK